MHEPSASRLRRARSIRPRTSLPGRILLVALTIWALAQIVPSLIQVVQPLAAFGLSADNDGVVFDVVQPFKLAGESPATVAGIRAGDRIDLRRMNCLSPASPECAATVAILGGLGGLQFTLPDHEIDLPLSRSASAQSTVHLRAQLAPLSWPGRVVLLADTIVGILFVLTAFRLAWIRPGRMTWGFLLYAAWFNPGQTFAYYAILQSWSIAAILEEVLEALLWGGAYAGLICFALRFPSGRAGAHWRWLDRRLPALGVILALLLLASTGNLFGYGTELVTRIALLSGYVVDAAVIAILLLRARKLPPQEEQRMRWVIAGVTIGLPAYILASICQSSGLLQEVWGSSPSQVAIGLLYLLNGVLAYFVAVAVRRRRVVSVAIPIRHGTIVIFFTLILGIPVLWIHELLAEYHVELDLPGWAWALVAGPLMLLLLQRLHEIGVQATDRAFNRHFHRARDRLLSASKALMDVASFEEIDRVMADEPVKAFRLTSGAVFRRVDGEFRRASHAVGWDHATLDTLRPVIDRLVLGSIETASPVRLPPGIWEPTELPQEEQAPCLALPIVGGAREAVAVALFGPHETGSDINADELEMLHDFAARAAAGYDRVETEILRREVRELRAQLSLLCAPKGYDR